MTVHGDTIGQHFLTTKKEVEEQPDEDTGVDGTGDEEAAISLGIRNGLLNASRELFGAGECLC